MWYYEVRKFENSSVQIEIEIEGGYCDKPDRVVEIDRTKSDHGHADRVTLRLEWDKYPNHDKMFSFELGELQDIDHLVIPDPDGLTEPVRDAAYKLARLVESECGIKNSATALYHHLISSIQCHIGKR